MQFERRLTLHDQSGRKRHTPEHSLLVDLEGLSDAHGMLSRIGGGSVLDKMSIIGRVPDDAGLVTKNAFGRV